jgi:hypothetical protein
MSKAAAMGSTLEFFHRFEYLVGGVGHAHERHYPKEEGVGGAFLPLKGLLVGQFAAI